MVRNDGALVVGFPFFWLLKNIYVNMADFLYIPPHDGAHLFLSKLSH
ncbi:hypothetical protein B4168_1819 [Anoxybacillus flavithermus]|nr:hypothetical protein B4168_1819 [Anoxybacillus flavithermus]OAO85474.1 hypothetical protein GT23_2377 [Parageobacillus thermoglucosidasius]